MKLAIPVGDGEPIDFECENNIGSRWTSSDILEGRTYPYLSFVDDVRVVFDVGANCGAASVHFARHYPEAEIHAFEPGSRQRAVLERNVAPLPNTRVHPIALSSTNRDAPLYLGLEGSGMSSLFRSSWTRDELEVVTVRDAADWVREHGIARIDVLKVDVEGSEVDVLTSLAPLLPTVKLLYVEYSSRAARRDVARLVEDTHELYIGKMFLDQGECAYISRAVAQLDAANEWLRSHFVAEQR